MRIYPPDFPQLVQAKRNGSIDTVMSLMRLSRTHGIDSRGRIPCSKSDRPTAAVVHRNGLIETVAVCIAPVPAHSLVFPQLLNKTLDRVVQPKRRILQIRADNPPYFTPGRNAHNGPPSRPPPPHAGTCHETSRPRDTPVRHASRICVRSRRGRGRLLPRQDGAHHRRRRGRFGLRSQCAAARALSAEVHPGSADRHRPEPAGRRQPDHDQPAGRRRAVRRHRDRCVVQRHADYAVVPAGGRALRCDEDPLARQLQSRDPGHLCLAHPCRCSAWRTSRRRS
jgi:hypothetical protein